MGEVDPNLNRQVMEFGKNPELTEKFKRLVHARKASPALQYGGQVELHATMHTYAFSRMRPDEEVVCVYNNSEEEKTVKFSLDSESCIKDGQILQDMFDRGYSVATAKRGKLSVTIPPKGYRFLRWTKPA